jgi:hypothetical protein
MAEPKFVIQGVDYPVPDWFSFTMDESEILHYKTGLTLDQIDEDIKFSPGLLSTLMIVAYMRGNPGAPRARAEKIVGGIQLTEVIETLFPDDEVEEDAGPPSQEPSASASAEQNASKDGSALSSGDASVNDSATSPESDDHPPIGTLRSVTQQDSHQEISAS